MPYKSAKVDGYHTRKFVKCKYCDKEAARNMVGDRNKGHVRTCGSKECLVAQYKDPEVARRKIYNKLHTCKKCSKEYMAHGRTQRWCYECAPDGAARAILQRYDITASEYKAILIRCDGTCPICEKRSAAAVDHNHKTGEVRGIICHSCNLFLGFIENEKLYARARDYLQGKITNL